jgi:hypothetical protein
MRSTLCWTILAVWVIGGGCSRPLAPSAPEAGAGPPGVAGADASLETTAAPAFIPQLTFRGTIVALDRNFEPRVRNNESFYVTDHGAAPPDTIPAFGTLEKVVWRPATGPAETLLDGEEVLTERGARDPVEIPEERESGPAFAPGNHALVLQAPDHAGGGEATVRFFAGFVPSSWWAGPDVERWPASTDGDGRSVDVIDWTTFTTSPAWPPDGRPYFGPESLATIPSARRPPGDDLDRRTFYEIFGNRIYARREGDTVHQDAWIVLIHGGYDKDSPYTPRVSPGDPALPPDFVPGTGVYPVLESLGLVGSPIGFRTQVTVRLENGMVVRAPQSGLYPVFDPASVFRSPVIAGYVRAIYSGRAYVVVRAEDGHGLLEPAITDPAALVALVDGGGGTAADRLARRRVITFDIASTAGAALARSVKP